MAIDTAAKRKSCIGLALNFVRPGVIPDAGNLGAPQRLHTDLLYSGIAASAPSGATLMALERAFGRRMFGRMFGRID